MAGPTLKKSTKMNWGALPYEEVHSSAEDPRLPDPPLGALVVVA